MVIWSPDDICMYGITMAHFHANNADLLNASANYVVYILQIYLIMHNGVYAKTSQMHFAGMTLYIPV